VSFRVTLNDLEWLRKIFNDTKSRAVSLRQLSFWYQQCWTQSLRVAFNDGSWSKSCAFVVATPRHRAVVRLLHLILLRFNQLSSFLGPVRPGPRTAGVAVAREHQYGYQDCEDGRNNRRPVWKRATTSLVPRHCRITIVCKTTTKQRNQSTYSVKPTNPKTCTY